MSSYLYRLFILILTALPVYILFRLLYLKKTKKQVSFIRETALAVFFLFLFGLLSLALEGTYSHPSAMLLDAVTRIRTGRDINLVPLRTIWEFFYAYEPDAFSINIAGNILMFLPWGFGLTLLWKKNRSMKRLTLLLILLPAFIETSQLFIGRHVDIDDLLLNFLGGTLGALLFKGMHRLFPSFSSKFSGCTFPD